MVARKHLTVTCISCPKTLRNCLDAPTYMSSNFACFFTTIGATDYKVNSHDLTIEHKISLYPVSIIQLCNNINYHFQIIHVLVVGDRHVRLQYNNVRILPVCSSEPKLRYFRIFQEAEAPRISRQSAHEYGQFVRSTHRPPLPSKRYPWYSFLLEAESTPEPYCGRKNKVNERSQWHPRELNP